MTIKDLCSALCSSCILLGGVISYGVTVTGIILAYIAKPTVITALQNAGSAGDTMTTIGTMTNLMFLIVLGINTLGLLPLFFANPPCRKRMFGKDHEDDSGCGACWRRFVQRLLGKWISSFMLFLVFMSLMMQMGFTFVFIFAATFIVLFHNICLSGDMAIGFAETLVSQVNDTDLGQYVQGMNVTNYCADTETTEDVISWSGPLMVGAIAVTVISQTFSFSAIAKAKETIISQEDMVRSKRSERVSRQVEEELNQQQYYEEQ